MLHQHAIRGEDVDIAKPGAGGLVVAAGRGLGVGDVKLAVDGLDVERRIACREGRVVERSRQGDAGKVGVEDVDAVVVKVGGVEAVDGAGDYGQAFVDRAQGRAVDEGQRQGRIDCGRPAGDRPGLSGIDELSGRGDATRGHPEIGERVVEDDPGRSRRARQTRRDRYDGALRDAVAVIEAGLVGAVVGNPDEAQGIEGQAPAIDKVGVEIDARRRLIAGKRAGRVPGHRTR